MPAVTLTFTDNPQLTGVNVGDMVYYIDTTDVASLGGFSTSSSLDNIVEIGTVASFGGSAGAYTIVITNSNNITLPTTNDYIFFSKDNATELSTVSGYFANLKFVNDSTDYAELFQVGVGVVESSK